MRNTFFVFFSFSLYGTEPPGCKFFSEAVSGKGETGASQDLKAAASRRSCASVLIPTASFAKKRVM